MNELDNGNLVRWIEDAAEGEPVEAIVIGSKGWGFANEDDIATKGLEGKVLQWSSAAPLLNYDFDCGYGGVGCHAITVWTKSRVIFVSQYDGSTCIEWVPRNPIDHIPTMPGG